MAVARMGAFARRRGWGGATDKRNPLDLERQASDTLPEWSKGVDSSSTSASCVGSNPTGVICISLRCFRSLLVRAREDGTLEGAAARRRLPPLIGTPPSFPFAPP